MKLLNIYKMKFFKYIFILLLFVSSNINASDWKTYLSYNNVQKIISTEKYIYVLASDGLYSYNRHDSSIQTYSNTNYLSDVKIKFITWLKSVNKLAIIYNNGNIDFLHSNGVDVDNISDYYLKNTSDDKTINNYFANNDILLLATNFGVVNINIKKCEIKETYRLNAKFNNVEVKDNCIYALSGNTLYIGNLSDNLLDKNNWTIINNNFTFSNNVEQPLEEDIITVNNIKLDGPKSNRITRLKFHDNCLYVASGGSNDSEKEKIVANFQEFSNNNWTYYEDYVSAENIKFTREVNDIAIDPRESKHIFVSTDGNGLYEFKDGKQIYNYTYTNTECIGSATATADYVLTAGVCFYSNNDLYFLNSQTSSALLRLSANKEMEHLRHNELFGLSGNNNLSWGNLCGTILDSRNLLWFVNDNHLTPALYKYNPEIDKVQRFNKFINQDGTTISDLNYVRCVTEDLEHNIWIGTEQGPLLLTPEMMDDPNAGFIQVKVPRNDGTNYADYLLSGVDISCIAVDAAGRKWFGTNGNGVYLISEDNMKQLEHFTTDNSCLLDNNIRDIAINNKTGEVFFASNSGLCSVISDATEANEEMTSETVWAYPNPVTPDFQGEISIVGLAINSTVTITSSSGHVVATGKSVGGSFKWNGCDKSGKRVASGVYMVHTATKEGKSGVVTKIAFIK